MAVSNWLRVLETFEDSEGMWDAFEHANLKAAEECPVEHLRSRIAVSSEETMRNIKDSRAARMAGNLDQYRILSRRTTAILRRYKRELCQGKR